MLCQAGALLVDMSDMAPTNHTVRDPRLNIAVDYHNVVDAQFFQQIFDRQLSCMRGDGWITSAGAGAAPGRIMARADYSRAGRLELLIEVEGAVAQLVFVDLSLHIRIAALNEHACEAALQKIREAMPPDPGLEQEVPVSFWWWEPRGPQQLGRMMPAPEWQDIVSNYSVQSLRSLEPMMAWETPPAGGGRLMLWHGAPGTGKTTALRALAREWREWADFQFITDPECFLQSPGYLLGAIAERSTPQPSQRWGVLVLEDAGEFLYPDAKQVAGQALSRLLNVCDGVLGQATRSLVLVTTNEDIRSLHPALARPGRCLAQVEFRELDRAEIASWCKARGIPAPSAARGVLADLFAHAEGRAPERPTEEFGFAAAAA